MSLEQFLRRKNVPLVVYLELLHRCSFLCAHCYIPEELRKPSSEAAKANDGLSTQEIFRLLDELAAQGTLFLVLTGGELFLRKDLNEILTYARKLGFVIKVYTNGFHITEAWAQRLAELEVFVVEVSVYAANEENYRSVTKIRGGWQRVQTAVQHLRTHGVRVTLKTPVMRLNVHDIPKIKEFAERVGAHFRYDLVIIPRFDGDQEPLQLRCSDDEVRELLNKLNAKLRVKPQSGEHLPTCSVGRWSAVIDPQGDVFPCIELRQKLGNVREQSFKEIWVDNPHMRRIRQVLDGASMPEELEDGMCGHCPAFSLREKGDMTQVSQEHKRIAEIKREFVHKEAVGS